MPFETLLSQESNIITNGYKCTQIYNMNNENYLITENNSSYLVVLLNLSFSGTTLRQLN